MANQKGIVLFFALIVLIIMTVIGVALAVNSGQSLRMAGAGSERIEAMAAAQGSQTKVISEKEGSVLALFSNPVNEVETVGDHTVANALTLLVDGDVDCQRNPNPTHNISCRRIEIESTVKFGRKKMGELTVVVGLEQEVIGLSGGG